MNNNYIEIKVNIISNTAVNLYLTDYEDGTKQSYTGLVDADEIADFELHTLTVIKIALLNVLYNNNLPAMWAAQKWLRPVDVTINDYCNSQVCQDDCVSMIKHEILKAFDDALDLLKKHEDYCKLDLFLAQLMYEYTNPKSQKPDCDIFHETNELKINIDWRVETLLKFVVTVSIGDKTIKRTLSHLITKPNIFDLYLEIVGALYHLKDDIEKSETIIFTGDVAKDEELMSRLYSFVHKMKCYALMSDDYDWPYL